MTHILQLPLQLPAALAGQRIILCQQFTGVGQNDISATSFQQRQLQCALKLRQLAANRRSVYPQCVCSAANTAMHPDLI